jgi:two-component system CheB/CheR fusion protein
VLGNLLGNAVKFTPRGGTVAVRVTREGGEAVLSVRDSGVGIAPEMQARLFEPFIQAPQTIERTLGGLGLGLAMVKELVALHGGEVAVASQGQGYGSTFTVRLPLGAAPVKAAAAPVVSEMRRHRILVIEDSVDTADSLRDALAEDGQDVQVANDGSTGLTLAREFRPEIVICDVGLPGMDGYAVARALRADPSLKGSYLIALSGYARADDRQRARDAGFDRHLAKPTSLESLERLLQEAPTLG